MQKFKPFEVKNLLVKIFLSCSLNILIFDRISALRESEFIRRNLQPIGRLTWLIS